MLEKQISATAFDPAAETARYLAKLPADAVGRVAAYTEGGHWLLLWSALVSIAIAFILLQTGFAAGLRDRLAARIKRPFPRTAAAIAIFVLADSLLSFPFAAYKDYFRERAYGLSTQTFPAWFGEFLISLIIGMIAMGLGFAVIYAVIRRTGRAWWIWGSATGVALLAFLIMIAPVYIEPLFNKYKPMTDGPVKTEILHLARANGVPASNVYQFDASRQTNRVSANVSGFAGTTRIALNDNLLRRASPDGVAAVMAHEIGHYTLNHIYKMLAFVTLILLAGFLFVDRGYAFVQKRFGARWGIGEIGDEAGYPLLIALLSLFLLLAQPFLVSIIRVQEAEADYFSLNATRKPDGFAEAMLMTAEYRKASPSPLEEALFYDHPSPKSRIMAAMIWKAEMLEPAKKQE